MPDVKINSDFLTYKESLFLGLNMRQFVCSILAVACAIVANIPLRPILGKDVAGFLSFVSALPLAAAGFFTYNGMPFERFAVAYLRQTMLAGFPRLYRTRNYLYELLRDAQLELNAQRKPQKAAQVQRRPAPQPRTASKQSADPKKKTITKATVRRSDENTKRRPAPPKGKQGKTRTQRSGVNTNKANHS